MQALKDQGCSTVADIKGVQKGELKDIPVAIEQKIRVLVEMGYE